jgi:dTDP-4-dehydrorhamnose 3,5-epimerase-like enzyme
MGAVEITKLKVHADRRGAVFEPLEPELLRGWRNVHTVVTELSAVYGPALVRYRSDERLHEVEVPAGEVWRFTFPPGVAHAFKNTGTAAIVLVSFNTVEHDPLDPDVERDALIDS